MAPAREGRCGSRGGEGDGKLSCAIQATGTRRYRRAVNRATGEAPRAPRRDHHRNLSSCVGSPVTPPDDIAVPAILPEPLAASAEKRSGPLPAGAMPEDVRHWFDLETLVELPAPLAGFADAAEAAAQYRRASRSENTRRAYRSAVARFTEWCAAQGQTALPASPETVAAFLAAEARAELAVNTLRLRHAAIRYMHLLRGYPPPTAAAVVSTTFAGIKRAHRRPLGKKAALVLDRLRAAIETIPETLPGLRDRALLLVGFAAALRPSEIARLTLEHLTRHPDGTELFLPWRKNDQDARGTKRLPQGRTDLCPVKALGAWLDAAAIADGALFRRIWRLPPPCVPRGTRRKPVADRYRIGTSPIDTDSIALIVKNWTGLAGFDVAAFAGHSLRRGAISTGVAQGVHIARLKQFSGHASLKSLEEYVELD
jgi:integrase